LKTLILGGARSGKSAYAEQEAIATGLYVDYIATAQGQDEEMMQRIFLHQRQRPASWGLIEEPVYLADTLLQQDADNKCILVDCLTLWLSNLLCHDDKALFEEEKSKLLQTLPRLTSHIIFVSNEVGQGIVPMGELNRRFVDESGRLHQQLATLCDSVIWIMAGLPQHLK